MRREAKVTIVVLALLLVAFLLVYVAASGVAIVTAPVQPIDFFHRVHAGDKQIACEYCHRTAKSAALAGMPSVELCMRCHRVVIPHYREIQKLHRYWESGVPIPWQRVNRLPGFVYFNHQAHTVTGKLDCAECHGKTETMDRLVRTAPLTMGWCLDCHRKKRASMDCWACHR
ncbi:MAG: cytochrome c3 family protein [Armatimonadetes bacterium]|nr:cytochrome c3 family protein [Armatimonadota bacterium]